MLYDVDRKEYVNSIPHLDFYQAHCARMTTEELAAVRDYMNNHVIGQDQIFCTSWKGSQNWIDTPLMSLYHACDENEEHAGWLFGLMVWDILLKDRPDEVFSYGRYQERAGPPIGLTYFRLSTRP